jgi:hypothetical protein
MVNHNIMYENCSDKSCMGIVQNEEERLLKIICMSDEAGILPWALCPMDSLCIEFHGLLLDYIAIPL